MASPCEKIPLGTEYLTQQDIGGTLTPEEVDNLFYANMTIDRYASNNTYYDDLGEIPNILKVATRAQYDALNSGEVSLVTGNVSGSFSIGSWSETSDNSTGSSQDSTTINMCNKCKLILQTYGYLYTGNIL